MSDAKLPSYVSHKVVQAAKILSMTPDADGLKPCRLTVGPLADDVIDVSAAYVAKHKPQTGGYYVRYADDYESWSPAEAFEEGYTPLSEAEDAAVAEHDLLQWDGQFNDGQRRFLEAAFDAAVQTIRPTITEAQRLECLKLACSIAQQGGYGPAEAIQYADKMTKFVQSGTAPPSALGGGPNQ